jgi:hypothetical protein
MATVEKAKGGNPKLRPVSKHEAAKIRRMNREGRRYAEIMAATGRSHSCIYRLIHGRERKRESTQWATGGTSIPKYNGRRLGDIESKPLLVFALREAYRLAGSLRFGRTLVCHNAGMSVRCLYSWETGERTHTQFETADRLLLTLERNWHEVYDPQAHEPGMFRSRQRDDVLAWLDVVDRASRLWAGEVLLGSDDPKLVLEAERALEWAA